MAANGYYRNPVTRDCWETCRACGRCSAAESCPLNRAGICSGRWDPDGKIDPHPRDFCKCKNGVLQWRTQKGEIVVVPFTVNPFRGNVQEAKITQDERDYEAYVNDLREKMDDPTYSPVQITG